MSYTFEARNTEIEEKSESQVKRLRGALPRHWATVPQLFSYFPITTHPPHTGSHTEAFY